MTIPSRQSQDKLIKYANYACSFLNNNFNLRSQLLERDRAYYRESGEAKNPYGDEVSTANMDKLTIPVVMPQVEGALTYLSQVYLESFPIFPVIGKPQVAGPALQMETIINDNSIRMGWVPNLLEGMRDLLKYNLGTVEIEWKTLKQAKVSTVPLESLTRGEVAETYYEGNRIKRCDPYNTIYDIRVKPSEQHTKAEFHGYTELYTRIALKQLFQELSEYTFNATEAFESGEGVHSTLSSANSYYVPLVNPNALATPTLTTGDFSTWFGDDETSGINYHNVYEVTTLYCRITPKEFGLPSENRGQVHIYKLLLVNRKVLIYCERQTSALQWFPLITAQAKEDGLGWQTKSFAEDGAPFQQAASALYNSGIESQRRKVYDRIFYNPSMFNKKDMDNVSSVARIPMKAQAYGMPIQNGILPVPYRDEGVANILGFSRDIVEMGDIANGQNRVQRGQFQRGNKSRTEFQTVMDRSDARNQLMALQLEHKFFVPIKETLKLNILQYQLPTEYYSPRGKADVVVDPVQLRNSSIQFQLADGQLPANKQMNLEAFQLMFQAAAQNPQLAASYDLVGAMMYYLQLQGASWLQDFKAEQPQLGVMPPGAPPVVAPQSPAA